MVDKIKADIIKMVEDETDLHTLDAVWKMLIQSHNRESGIEIAYEEQDVKTWAKEVEESSPSFRSVQRPTPAPADSIAGLDLPFQRRGTVNPLDHINDIMVQGLKNRKKGDDDR